MDRVICLLVLSTVPQLVIAVPPVASLIPTVELVSGHSRVFSGENVRLTCHILDIHKSNWDYLWFKESEQLTQHGKHLTLWKTKVKDTGKYYCQGTRDTAVGNIQTLKSQPLEISVDGGLAILQVPPHHSLVGDTLNVTCRVRGTPQLHEVILYRDGVEVLRQQGLSPHLHLTDLSLEDNGVYSCRASWDIERQTVSVISVGVPVQVLEVLSEPVLEIVQRGDWITPNMIKLICHHQYNAPAPVPPVSYFFYKDNNRLGIATSVNYDLVKQTPGEYSCKVKVSKLNISRWSQPKRFGRVQGPQGKMPHRELLSIAPTVPPQAAQPSSHRSTAIPTPDEGLTQSSGPLLKPSQSMPSSLQSTAQSLYQTPLAETDDLSMESVNMSGMGPLV
ncbi:basement membrane-specific heparan sulfate proteoglycan core protein-like isoform X2 [Morone saxatilis]|uniref:basement membrane-specific heparan sulfate proteoglycan core protein-like isoform X2 n=1 Tax=Morone saxatilis TaxID=34816 RepID=UPI0015E1D491|nr:basement membrane-specific heparan sulfate proteoglycan core protein-like isoform X2 [Morone saxatilis]